jgi:hypothetical protein
MLCCAQTILPFTNEPITVIGLTDALKNAYSFAPNIEVVYLDEQTGEYVLEGIITNVHITSSQIIIDHGGNATGFIKLN